MLIFYVDESGHHTLDRDPLDPGKLGPSSPWFILAAAGIADTARRSLAEQLMTVKRKHFGSVADSADWTATEIKGRHLAVVRNRLNGRPSQDVPAGYAAITTIEQLAALENDLRITIARYRPTLFSIAIDKQRLIDRSPGVTALDTAYAFLYRRVALTLQTMHPGGGAVFVADQQTEHESHFNSGKLIAFRDQFNQKGSRRAQHELILDKPLWIDTKLSSWDREIIQIADLAAFMTNECVKWGGPPEPAALWQELRRCMAVGMNGEPDGEGLVIYPMPVVWPLTQ